MTPPVGPDPRVERSREVILDATLEELAAVGYGAMTVEGVARRAGVSKATVYRHWEGKLDLVGDTIETLKALVVVPDTDDHRERIRVVVRGVAEHCINSRFSACMPAIIDAAERDASVREFHHRTSTRRREMMIGVLADARDAGNLPPDVDTATLAEMLVAPIFLRRLMTPMPYTLDQVDTLVDTVLAPYWRD